MIGTQRGPVQRDVVLVGGGHAHVQVMTAFAMRPAPGVRLTLVTERLATPYSGMLPGHVAGLSSREDMHIELARLARATGTRLIHAVAVGLDKSAKRLLLADRPPLPYDLLSLNLGITPDLGGIAGAAEHGVAVKPISTFLERLAALLDAAKRPDGPRRLVVVGGGAAGFELACALRVRLDREAPGWGVAPRAFQIALASSDALVPTLNAGVRRRAEAALQRLGIDFHTDFRVARIGAESVEAEDGRSIACDAALFATAARAPSWLAQTGLPLAGDGSVTIRRTLQVIGEEAIFAVGDCAFNVDEPRPKAGVFAVRQGPALTENLRRKLAGRPLTDYRAQRRFLTLLLSGEREAIAGRGRWFSASGRMIWRWKNRIDTKFMAMFADFGREAARPATAAELEAGAAMRCGGCAAKVGPAPLAQALRQLPPAPQPQDRILIGLDAPDDAAVVEVAPGVIQVETVDQIRAFLDDLYVFGRIAALHAINDVIAMGGQPTRALALASAPHGAADKVAADLAQMLAGARREFDAHDVALIGGHSSEAETPALGFAVSGRVAPEKLMRKGGLAPGDRLILSKGLGVGLVMAADMRGAAPAEASAAAIASMLVPNARAGAVAAGLAHAMTDVSGFGLAGHLHEMLRASGVSARLDLDALPLIDGALALARAGFMSSLTPQNQILATVIDGASTPEILALLFDPQTSGPLLIAVTAERAQQCLGALQAAGYGAAAIIGEIVADDRSEPRIRLSGAV